MTRESNLELAVKNMLALFEYKKGTRNALLTHIQHFWPADAKTHAKLVLGIAKDLVEKK